MKCRSNGELLQAVRELVSRVRGVTRELLVELGELDARRLYLEEACSSMFAFCTTRLGFSEDVAYKRIQAARLGRRFPALLEAFGAGRVHLAGLAILGPHLTAANHRELLAAAAGLTKRQLESLVADRFAPASMARPKATLRRLRVPVADGHKRVSCSKRAGCGSGSGSRDLSAADSGAGGCGGRARISQEAGPGGAGGRPRVGLQPGTQAAGIAAAEASAELAPGRVAVGPTGERRPRASAAQALPASKAVTSPPGERPTAPDVEPPSPGAEPRAASAIYRLSLTVGKEFAEKLETARAHLSHSIPDGDLARILELGLDALLADKRRSRCAERVQDRKLARPSDPRQHGQAAEPTPGDVAPPKKNGATEGPPAKASADRRRQEEAATDGPPQSAPMDRSLQGTAANKQHRASKAGDADRSRYIRAEIRRLIWARDQGCCTFVDAQGRRCRSRWFLQIDHIHPHALGGSNSASNLRLLCGAHNRQRAREGNLPQARTAPKPAGKSSTLDAARLRGHDHPCHSQPPPEATDPCVSSSSTTSPEPARTPPVSGRRSLVVADEVPFRRPCREPSSLIHGRPRA